MIQKSKESNNKKIFNVELNLYNVMATVITIAVIGFLLYVVAFLPPFGSPNNPTVNETSQRYVEKAVEETGAVNSVASLILNFRGFDTFGEATILFIAVEGVISMLRKKYHDDSEEGMEDEKTTK